MMKYVEIAGVALFAVAVANRIGLGGILSPGYLDPAKIDLSALASQFPAKKSAQS